MQTEPFRLIGAALVVGCGVFIGVSYSLELRRRYYVLKAFVDALPALRREICDLHTPTLEALKRAAITFADVQAYPDARQLERVLGRVDSEEQRDAINRAEVRLSGQLSALEAARAGKAKVAAAVCVSCGLMLAIVLF